MTATASTAPLWIRWRCPYRALILAASVVGLLWLFWFVSRYPQLLQKAEHVGQAVPSIAAPIIGYYLSHGNDPEVRLAAVESLANLPPQVVRPLRPVLEAASQDSDRALSTAAAQLLARVT